MFVVYGAIENKIQDANTPKGDTYILMRRMNGVADGARTHDNQNHNLALYQLNYGHHINPAWRARQDSNLQPSA